MVFCEKLKELRLSKNLTQKQLACRLGLTSAAISSYENGTRTPSADIMSSIASVFNVTLDTLLGSTKPDIIDVSGVTVEQRAIIEELVTYFKTFNEITKTALKTSKNSTYSNILKKNNLYDKLKKEYEK